MNLVQLSLLAAVLAAYMCVHVLASGCTFPDGLRNHTDKDNSLARLHQLQGKTISVSSGEHKYTIGVCTDAIPSKPGVGAVQYITKVDSGGNETVEIGLLNQTDVSGDGAGWVMLSYGGGRNYSANFCGSEPRRALLMFVCNHSATQMHLTFVEENKYLGHDCYYMFQVDTDVLCSKGSPVLPEGLSSSSIFCILVIVGISVYLLIGLAYRRLMVGAKGLEQIPNYEFWKEFGRLEADGCDFVCRCGDRYSSRSYRDIDSHLTNEFSDTNADPDDALLRP